MQSMLYKTRIPFLIFFSLCSALMSYAQEGISLRDGRYEVFYTTFNSSFITPEVAKAYGFVRGANRALINVAVISFHPLIAAQCRAVFPSLFCMLRSAPAFTNVAVISLCSL